MSTATFRKISPTPIAPALNAMYKHFQCQACGEEKLTTAAEPIFVGACPEDRRGRHDWAQVN